MTTTSLTNGMNEILHHSILHYLHRSGFSKTFKRFQSEAQIQNDSWKTSSANLEDIYCKYINACRDTEGAKKDGKDVCIVKEKTTRSKKTKKNSVECNKDAIEDETKTTMSHGESLEDNVVVESETKAKKKKKSKHDLETEEAKSAAPVDDTMNELEGKKKPKDKKRKSKQQEAVTENGQVAKEEEKSCKKRKRLSSDENDDQSLRMEANQTVDESKEDQVDKQMNEKPETEGGEKSGSQKSMKTQSSVNDTDIMKLVLGERSGQGRGVGRKNKKLDRYAASSSSSQAPPPKPPQEPMIPTNQYVAEMTALGNYLQSLHKVLQSHGFQVPIFNSPFVQPPQNNENEDRSEDDKERRDS